MDRLKELRERRDNANRILHDIYQNSANRELNSDEKLIIEILSNNIKQYEEEMCNNQPNTQNIHLHEMLSIKDERIETLKKIIAEKDYAIELLKSKINMLEKKSFATCSKWFDKNNNYPS